GSAGAHAGPGATGRRLQRRHYSIQRDGIEFGREKQRLERGMVTGQRVGPACESPDQWRGTLRVVRADLRDARYGHGGGADAGQLRRPGYDRRYKLYEWLGDRRDQPGGLRRAAYPQPDIS